MIRHKPSRKNGYLLVALFSVGLAASCSEQTVPVTPSASTDVVNLESKLSVAFKDLAAGDIENSERIFNEISNMELRSPTDILLRARLAYEIGNFEYSYRQAMSLLKLTPENQDAYELIFLAGTRLEEPTGDQLTEMTNVQEIIAKNYRSLLRKPDFQAAMDRLAQTKEESFDANGEVTSND